MLAEIINAIDVAYSVMATMGILHGQRVLNAMSAVHKFQLEIWRQAQLFEKIIKYLLMGGYNIEDYFSGDSTKLKQSQTNTNNRLNRHVRGCLLGRIVGKCQVRILNP